MPSRRPRPLPPRLLAIAGEEVAVEVRESPRARRARIVVRPARAPEVVVPAGTGEAVVDRLLAEHAGWLHRQVLRSRALARRASLLGLDRPGVVWLHGTPLPVVRASGGRGVARIGSDGLEVAGSDDAATGAIERWYRREARARTEIAVAREARRLGLRPGPITIRDQRTRWASCAQTGALSFSWRLVLAPEPVLDYVVLHELCHLRRHDHSRAFWRLVDQAMPGWELHARWLRDHGVALHAYSPATAVAPAAIALC